MANSTPIKYHGEVLCCLDQTEVKAAEPYSVCKPSERNVWRRMHDWLHAFFTGREAKVPSEVVEEGTRILFKDGTDIRIKMPFTEFHDAYC